MKRISDFFKLIRGGNLFLIAACMYFFQYFVIRFWFGLADLPVSLSHTWFAGLVLATVCIAAGGNLINDILDFEVDLEFKPAHVLLGKVMSLETAEYVLVGLNLLGVGLGFLVAYHVGVYQLGYVFVIAAILLAVYSTFLKGILLVGNIAIGLLAAFVFVEVTLFEVQLVNLPFKITFLNAVHFQMIGYALFAFATTFIREIMKDAEDVEGDQAAGLKTLPVLISTKFTNYFLILLLVVLVGLIGWVQKLYWQDHASNKFYYCLFILQIPLLFYIFSTYRAKSSLDYKKLSTQFKIFIVFGILTLPIFYLMNIL